MPVAPTTATLVVIQQIYQGRERYDRGVGETADLLEIMSRVVGLDSDGARALGDRLLSDPQITPVFHAKTLAIVALTDYIDARYAEAVISAERAMAIARSTGDSEALLYAHGMRLFASAGVPWAGAEADVDEYFSTAWAMRHELDNLEPESRMIAGHLLVEGTFATGRLPEAGELLEFLGDVRATRRPEDEASHPYLPFMQLQPARVLFFQGRIAEALPIVEAVIADAERVGDRIWTLLAQGYLAMIAAHSGDAAATRRITSMLAAEFPDPHGYLEGAVNTLSAYALVVAGELESAVELAVRGGGGPALPNLQVADRALTYDLLVTVALAQGDIAAAEEWANWCLPLGAHPAGSHLVEQIFARIDLARGEASTSADRAEIAAARARLHGRYLDAGRSDLLRARALAASGLRDAAVQGFIGVGHGAERDGNAYFRSSAVAALRHLGRRLPPIPGGGWAVLSERERQIAVLAAEGFSNKTIGDSLYLSDRTVQTHMSRVLAALGVSSRASLPAQIAEQRLGRPQDDLPELTARQWEIADLIASGVTNREIADALTISVKTVEKHIGEILQRWAVSSRTGIANLVIAEMARIDG